MSPAGSDRRSDILAAAYRRMSRDGYERTSTARICAEAGVSSGTFFHYFPTKVSVLVAVLESGLTHTRRELEQIRSISRRDPIRALAAWREHVLSEAADPDLAGFAAALGAAPSDPGVTAALDSETALVQEVLTEVVASGQAGGQVRSDVAAERLALWLSILAQGILTTAVSDDEVVSPDLKDEFTDTVDRLLADPDTPHDRR